MDVVSAFPFQILRYFYSSELGETLRIVSFIKIFRLWRIRNLFLRLSTNGVFNMVRMIVIMAIIVHWIGCIWFTIVSYSTVELWIPPKDL